jgi:pyruvate, water dikinase
VDATRGVAALPLAAALEAGEDAVGGKAMGLSRLVRIGLPVPDAVVLPIGWAGDADDLLNAVRHLRPAFAVRSSAAGEDSAERSAAGQYETVTGVRRHADIEAAVARCRASAGSQRVRAYAGDDAAAGLAIVIQHQVNAGRSGVAFSLDPVTGLSDDVLVEAVFGFGEGLVAGLITPDAYRVAAGGAVQARVSAKPVVVTASGRRRRLPPERQTARTLRDDEARAVAALVRTAERGFGFPVDVEFCFEGSRLWLVQCRPVTGVRTP